MGKIPTLECNVCDTVPMSFGRSASNLEECLEEKRSGSMQHDDWKSGGGAPTLSPLFDDLLSKEWTDRIDLGGEPRMRRGNVATFRITHFDGGGTAVGINISHLLGDASSCFRIAESWGREMRGLRHPVRTSNKRVDATLTGMVSPDMVEFLNLDDTIKQEKGLSEMALSKAIGYFRGVFGIGINAAEVTDLADDMGSSHSLPISHQYVRMNFSPKLVKAMKAYGMVHCSSMPSVDNDLNIGGGNSSQNTASYVSTNDMVTAFGWIMKRYITKKLDWNTSMVVNLRNRGGIDDFSCVKDGSGEAGVFGNALTHIVAKLPPTTEACATMSEVGKAAVAIRRSLRKDVQSIPDSLYLSKAGRPAQAPDQGSCFSSTSWRQFPLWDISFSHASSVCGFYGRPSYPLPVDSETYSSVLVPSDSGGCTYQMLAPSRQTQSILRLHRQLSAQFLTWAEARGGMKDGETNATYGL